MGFWSSHNIRFLTWKFRMLTGFWLRLSNNSEMIKHSETRLSRDQSSVSFKGLVFGLFYRKLTSSLDGNYHKNQQDQSWENLTDALYKDFMWFKLKMEHQHSTRIKVDVAYDINKSNGFRKWPTQGLQWYCLQGSVSNCIRGRTSRVCVCISHWEGSPSSILVTYLYVYHISWSYKFLRNVPSYPDD